MINFDKLSVLFSESAFVESIKDLDNLDAVYAAVASKIPEVTKDEVENFLTAIAANVGTGEITDDELDNVSGGIGFLAVVGGAAAVIGLMNGCYTMGNNLGKLIGNLKKK